VALNISPVGTTTKLKDYLVDSMCMLKSNRVVVATAALEGRTGKDLVL